MALRGCALRREGFTLLEMVIAVAILSVLVVMAVPVVKLELQRQKETQLRESLRDLRNAIDAYKRAVDDGRILRKAEATGYPPHIEDLVRGVPDARDPKKQRTLFFLRRIPRDPFNDDANMPAADTWGLRSYASTAEDPSTGDDVFDVYSMSPGVGLNGVPYRQW
jgi:general secretion pathway protein G